MDEVKTYWRDIVTRLLGWGTGAFLLLCTWATDRHEKFELGILWSRPNDVDDVARGISLIVGAVFLAVVYPLAMRRIYDEHLSADVDGTVIPRHYVLNYARLLGVMLVLLAVMLGIF